MAAPSRQTDSKANIRRNSKYFFDCCVGDFYSSFSRSVFRSSLRLRVNILFLFTQQNGNIPIFEEHCMDFEQQQALVSVWWIFTLRFDWIGQIVPLPHLSIPLPPQCRANGHIAGIMKLMFYGPLQGSDKMTRKRNRKSIQTEVKKNSILGRCSTENRHRGADLLVGSSGTF